MRHSRPSFATLFATVLAAVLAPTPATAQRVTGTVVEAGSGAPVQGAFVALLDTADARVMAGLAGEDGGFTLEPGAPGRYRLRVSRIGYRTISTDLFDLAAGETVTRRIEVPGEAVSLGTLEVGGTGRCVMRPEEGEATWALWSEARKALEIAEWAEEEARFEFDVAIFRRTLDDRDFLVEHEEVELKRIQSRQPFVSDPPERLASEGYVRESPFGAEFYAPDAAALLSDPFMDTHCFRAVPGAGHLTGLAFQPIEGRETPDIEGTLWLDSKTAELRQLDYRYRAELRGRVDPETYGGVVMFRRLPDGAWIVERWRIRMPGFELKRRACTGCGHATVLSSYAEIEGDILAIRAHTGEAIPYARVRAAVAGRVMDPATGRPLGGATVRLQGTPYEVVTDPLGEFRLDGLPLGRYEVVAFHPPTEWTSDALTVELRLGVVSEVEIR